MFADLDKCSDDMYNIDVEGWVAELGRKQMRKETTMQYDFKVLPIEEVDLRATNKGFGPQGNWAISPEALEQELHYLGDQGWQVVCALNIHKHEKYLILQKERTV